MPSLDQNFDELRHRLRQGRDVNPTGFDPVFYLIFSPRDILTVKRRLPAWSARLRDDGWNAHRFSMAAELADIFANAPLRRIWLEGDRKAPTEWKNTNDSLSRYLARGFLRDRLRARLEELDATSNACLLVTDLEALHPYLRIGTIEAQLTGMIRVPTVIFYPGVRTSETGLKFLSFHDEDGNYRSVHIGG